MRMIDDIYIYTYIMLLAFFLPLLLWIAETTPPKDFSLRIARNASAPQPCSCFLITQLPLFLIWRPGLRDLFFENLSKQNLALIW